MNIKYERRRTVLPFEIEKDNEEFVRRQKEKRGIPMSYTINKSIEFFSDPQVRKGLKKLGLW